MKLSEALKTVPYSTDNIIWAEKIDGMFTSDAYAVILDAYTYTLLYELPKTFMRVCDGLEPLDDYYEWIDKKSYAAGCVWDDFDWEEFEVEFLTKMNSETK